MAFDLLVELLVEFVKRAPKLLFEFARGIWRGARRAVNVKREAPEDHHSVTEYVDAFLFGEHRPRASGSSGAPSVLDRDRR